MIKLKERGKKTPEIMLSPMIDMMFLLLIFFIVSAMYMSELRTIPVKLPVATETITQSSVKFTVTIKDDGAYWLGDKVIDRGQLIAKAKEVNADAILVSQTVTQKDVHIHNLTNMVELMEAEGLRDKVILCCGGPRISHELAQELGNDAGFGPHTYAEHVASYILTEIVKRGWVEKAPL